MAKAGEKAPGIQEAAAKRGSSPGFKIAVIAAAAVIIALLAVIVVLLNKKPEAAESGSAPGYVRGTVLTEDNVEEVLAKAEEPVEAGSYNCTMNMEWHFENSSKASYDAYVLNSDRNTHTVYFDVFLEETNELVYSSPYLPVGSSLDSIQLSSQLAAGTYPAIVNYHLVDNEQRELSTVAVAVTLFVEN